MNVVVPTSNFVTGVDVEEKSFTWTIGNFHVIRTTKSMINSEKIDFTAGETTGHPSQWDVHLSETRKDEKRWIGIYLRLNSPSPTDPIIRASYSQMHLIIKNKDGEIITDKVTSKMLISTVFVKTPTWGFHKFIDADDANFCPEESLVIYVTFKLYTPSSQPKSLEDIMKKFQATFSDKLRKDLASLLKNPIPCSDIKVISNDKKEFTVQRGILAVRSGVFAAMLSSNMIEATSGVIQLPDISSHALKVLHNFLYTGELLPEWRDADGLVELTNAAAKYQLQDLLQFLDLTIGKICQKENVMPLLILAGQLSLKVAEKELMDFARREWVNTPESFIQFWNMLTADESDEPERKKQKVN